MSSTLTVTLAHTLTVVETFSGALPGDQTASFAPAGGNLAQTLTASTTPAVTKHAEFTQALSSGAATIDLTQLPGKTADETVVGTGLKAQVIQLTNPSTNANKIIVSNGASNPYRIDGATTAWSIPLAPGQSTGPMKLNGAGDTVGSSHKTIDLAGTGAQTLEVMIVLGT